jgi:hypothetical protein
VRTELISNISFTGTFSTGSTDGTIQKKFRSILWSKPEAIHLEGFLFTRETLAPTATLLLKTQLEQADLSGKLAVAEREAEETPAVELKPISLFEPVETKPAPEERNRSASAGRIPSNSVRCPTTRHSPGPGKQASGQLLHFNSLSSRFGDECQRPSSSHCKSHLRIFRYGVRFLDICQR